MTDQQIKAQEDQHVKLEEIYFLYKENIKELGFFGKAGVGKTYCAKKLVDLIKSDSKNKDLKIIGATISHSAKNILKKSLGNDIEVVTVASMLQLRKVIDPITGEVDFLPQNITKNGKKIYPPITYADIIIIDECSQINDKTKDLIDTYRKYSSVVIYLGDWHQTPPVEDDKDINNRDSSTFNIPNVHLNIPYRYEGELEELANAIAFEIDKYNETGECDFKFLYEFTQKESNSYSFYRNEQEFMETAVTCFKQSKNLKHCVVVCYRNETAEVDNLRLKEMILNTDEMYTTNEKLVAKSSLFLEGEILIQNNSLYTVKSKELVTYAFICTKGGKYIGKVIVDSKNNQKKLNDKYYNDIVVYIDAYHLVLIDIYGKQVFDIIPVLTKSNDKKFNYFKSLLHSRCKKLKIDWKDYYNVSEYFTPFDSAYVVNTYVVQGDTYENVFVNFRDIVNVKPISRKEKLQSLYTAVTRAKTHVSILI
jgi:nucleoside-triphosphatase THEP1